MDLLTVWSALVGGIAGAAVSSGAAIWIYRQQAKALKRDRLLRTLLRIESFLADCHRCAVAAEHAEGESIEQGRDVGAPPSPVLHIDESVALDHLDSRCALAVMGFTEELRNVQLEADDEREYNLPPDAYRVMAQGFARIGLRAADVARIIREALHLELVPGASRQRILEDLERLGGFAADTIVTADPREVK